MQPKDESLNVTLYVPGRKKIPEIYHRWNDGIVDETGNISNNKTKIGKSRRVGLKKYLIKGLLILGDVLYFSFQIFLIIVFLVLTIHCLKMGMLAATAMCAIAAVIVGVWSVKNINSRPSKLIEEWKADKK